MIDLTERPVQAEYAGFWLRFVAHLIDNLVLSVPFAIIIIPFFLFTGFFDFTHNFKSMDQEEQKIAMTGIFMGAIIIAILANGIIGWLYYALMESSSRQATVGKLVLGLKVTDINGDRISFGRATGRYFGKALSNLTLHIGYMMAGFTEKKQALHDIIADCLVVKK
ncbi:MAG: RDD family protein [Bacteroidia bacterium]